MIGRPVSGMIFDKDGTLFDFNATWAGWIETVLRQETEHMPDRLAPLAAALGYDLQAGAFFKNSVVIAGTVAEIADAALPYLDEKDPAQLIARFNVAAAQASQVAATDLPVFLGRLQNAGLKLGVATNDAEAPARAHLRGEGVEATFDFIAGFDSGFGGKPAPGQLLAFCDVTGVAPDQCVMVGDSTHDLRAGRAAGMRTIGVLTGLADRNDFAPDADLVLSSIEEIPALLGL